MSLNPDIISNNANSIYDLSVTKNSLSYHIDGKTRRVIPLTQELKYSVIDALERKSSSKNFSHGISAGAIIGIALTVAAIALAVFSCGASTVLLIALFSTGLALTTLGTTFKIMEKARIINIDYTDLKDNFSKEEWRMTLTEKSPENVFIRQYMENQAEVEIACKFI